MFALLKNKIKIPVINIKDTFSISTISVFILFLLMLWSMMPWFSWKYKGIGMIAISCIFIFSRSVTGWKSKFKRTLLITIGFTFLVYSMVRLRNSSGLNDIINSICPFIVFVFVITMNKIERKNIVYMSTNIYAWILGISLIAFILVQNGFPLPYHIITTQEDRIASYPPFKNYILFINSTRSLVVERFRSIFTEPGHLGTISALFLFVNKYEIKRKSVLVIFIALLMTVSLSAYVLSFLGYLIYIVANSKRLYKTVTMILLFSSVIVTAGYYLSIRYPDNLLNRRILLRLALDEDKGIAGNNRTTANFDYYYETQFLTSHQSILFGKKMDENERYSILSGGNNSYRVFMFQNGAISMILLFLMYFSIVAVKPSRLGFGLLLLYCISFTQRTQTPLWAMQLFLFVGAIQCFYDGKHSKLFNDGARRNETKSDILCNNTA